MKIRMVEVVLGLVLAGVVASAFAQTWTLAGGTNRNDWYSVASSADGKIVCAVSSVMGPIISKDYGKTWRTNAGTWGAPQLNTLAVSADGKTIVGALGSNSTSRFFISTNSGDTWFRILTNQVTCVSCSADGSQLIAAFTAGYIYVSTNLGGNWRTNASIKQWNAVACAGNGNKFFAAVSNEKIYASSDGGISWTASSAPLKSWLGIACSADGKRVAAVANDGVYLSSDSGNTWVTNNSVSGSSVACSADGARLLISGGQVFLSDDFGATWRTNIATSTFYSGAASSADGCRLAVLASLPGGKGIWIARTNPAPQLDLRSTDGNLTATWTVPSTNFVLQQNADVGTANWVSVTNSPVLDYTNVQYHVSIPTSESNGFFRLMAQ